MNATTTHDTKRSEDARARIAVLSEIPNEWEYGLQRWSGMNRKYGSRIDGAYVPDRNEEYLFYQTLVATWPLDRQEWPDLVQRLQDYLFKAVREAKVHTRWSQPNEPHENALRDFITGVLNRDANSEFFADFEAFQKRTALYGMLNGLAQVLLKAACPGVTDIYQGSELWDFRLVDPDNRSLVDFGKRISLFERLRTAQDSDTNCEHGLQELLECWCDSRVKLYVLSRALAARRENPTLFLDGDYLPLQASGRQHERIVAFARRHAEGHAITVVPRCVAGIQAPVNGAQRADFWRDTIVTLPETSPDNWVNILAGANSRTISVKDHRLSIGDVFGDFPIALLAPTGSTKPS